MNLGETVAVNAGSQSICGSPIFAEFRIGVGELFAMPE
jgi:hypothetical protein